MLYLVVMFLQTSSVTFSLSFMFLIVLESTSPTFFRMTLSLDPCDISSWLHDWSYMCSKNATNRVVTSVHCIQRQLVSNLATTGDYHLGHIGILSYLISICGEIFQNYTRIIFLIRLLFTSHRVGVSDVFHLN